VLVIVAHADDPALFCGGTLRRMADDGVRLAMIRVTDDRFDSVGLGVDETISRNTHELRAAAEILGIGEIIELGYRTDSLSDVSEVELRERFIFHVRRLRPYAVMSYDPYGAYGEDNQDHIRVAQAVDETYWTAQFDKHHPEHFEAGIAPHGVYERWYFARRLTEITMAVDISTSMRSKVEAVTAHQTMMRNLAHQLRLQARTGEHNIPELEEIVVEGAAIDPLVERLVTASARATGARHGLDYAEEFRVVRFSGLEAFFEIGAE
jgi:LmbE family N-acetylglucosaminyl deacetylase